MPFSVRYRALVAAQPAATIWHDPEFLLALRPETGTFTWRPVELLRQGRCVAVLPLCLRRIGPAKFVSVPLAQRYAPPLFDADWLHDVGAPEGQVQLLHALRKVAPSVHSSWQPEQCVLTEKHIADLGFQTALHPTYLADLRGGAGELLARCSKSTRKNIRKAAHFWRLEQDVLNPEHVEFLQRNTRRLGARLTLDASGLLQAAKYLQSRQQILSNQLYAPDGELCTVSVSLADAHRNYCLYSASSGRHARMSGGTYALYQNMLWGQSLGLPSTDFLGSRLPGPAQNRRLLGGQLSKYRVFWRTGSLLAAYRKLRQRLPH